jgi:Flp pilus assembly protein TadD
VFFTLATALNGEADDAHTLIHTRIAAWLRPDHTEAQLLTAGLLTRLDQPELATEAYAMIKPDNPSYHVAEIGRANALVRAGKTEAAIEVLTALARSHGQIIGVQAELGNLLRREDKFEAAITAYDAAIALLGETPAAGDWGLFFARGVAQERQKRWDMAVADFSKALELYPDQPQVLNYLGYSYLERNTNLDEALSMIERAVAAEPDSGYIVDSLAWALFRLGRYTDAVAPMERASLLEPVDAVVTDHLGDVYWAVGRKLEAQFQWRRALSFDPLEPDAARIRRKLEVGLDKVLAEEGAKPIEAQTAADGL